MRRAWMIVVCTILCQAMSPSPSYAWWDGFEHLSGPGPFYGWDIQLRLFCVVDGGKTPGIRSSGPVGAILSVCRVDRKAGERERMMVDLGVRFLNAKGVPQFANGSQIDFTTLEPAVMFPVAKKGFFRLDYGFGAGVYWISSNAFESVRGTLIEPVRFDFRFGSDNWKYFNAFVVRTGLVNFPAGFDFDRFLGTSGHDGRVSSDWAKTISLFVDLTPLATKWAGKMGL